jgi:signal peptidase II
MSSDEQPPAPAWPAPVSFPALGAAPGPDAPPVPEPISPWAFPPAPQAIAPAHPVAAAPSSPPAARSFLIFVTLLALTADLGTKIWAKARLSGFDEHKHTTRKIEVLKNHADFIFAQNPGGAWSFLRSLPDSLRRPFFLVVSAAAIVFIITVYGRVRSDQHAMKWGLPLALGGAIGNLADRIRFGWVVDFVDVYVNQGGHEHHWPTFNVADIAIVIGVALMAIDMMRSSRRARAALRAPPFAGAPRLS